jgi:hypothetical protein
MKNWEIELMGVMAKSNVDNTQKDVIEFFNKKLTTIITEVESRTYFINDKKLVGDLKKEYLKD